MTGSELITLSVDHWRAARIIKHQVQCWINVTDHFTIARRDNAGNPDVLAKLEVIEHEVVCSIEGIPDSWLPPWDHVLAEEPIR